MTEKRRKSRQMIENVGNWKGGNLAKYGNKKIQKKRRGGNSRSFHKMWKWEWTEMMEKWRKSR